jgi:hypothetical protein
MNDPWLNDEERAWVKRVQKLLNSCPSDRLGFFTIGDRSVEIYDKSYDEEIEAHGRDFCQGVRAVGAHLAELTFPSNVHSTAG